jgi:hypothetical protein
LELIITDNEDLRGAWGKELGAWDKKDENPDQREGMASLVGQIAMGSGQKAKSMVH